MTFSSHKLLSLLPADKALCHIAYSGGMDSHVLLQALSSLQASSDIQCNLKAIHIHHGLSPNADSWAAHCKAVCEKLGIPLEIIKVDVDCEGQSIETAARNARMAVFEKTVDQGEYLLTAHHLDDQMETMLFRMLRGTGMRGLGGIHEQRALGNGVLLRPLLAFSRAELKAFAEAEQLQWLEDESNENEAMNRNFLRRQVLPKLESRWPGFRKNWQRLAQLANEGQVLQQVLGEQDLLQIRHGCHRLKIPPLLEHDLLRQRNILRSWFLSLEEEFIIPSPDSGVISRILDEVIPAAEDATPLVSWQKGGKQMNIRRFADMIYLQLSDESVDESIALKWQLHKPLVLPGNLGSLNLVEASTNEEGFKLPLDKNFEVRFKQGGETAKPSGRRTRSLKKIMQDYRVPPWLRSEIPLVFQESSLLAVADLFICEQWSLQQMQSKGEKLYRIHWDKSDLHCGY